MPRLASAPLFALALLLAACGGSGGKATPIATSTPTIAPIATPVPTATPGVHIPTISPTTDITLPEGFAAYEIASDFKSPTSIARAPDGRIYISEQGGSVYWIRDADGDGLFEQHVRFASGFKTITGIMVAPDGTLYVSSTGRITTVRDTDADGVGDDSQVLIDDLPTGRHQNNGLAIGPDGMLYITDGSTCDDCNEDDPFSATILQANIDGSGLRVYARGLRNPYDLTFDGQGRLWATDNGSDAPCATIDELNQIVDGGDYGWPYGDDGCDPYNDGIPPSGDLLLHSASTGIAFYDGAQFPAAYAGSLFITLWGGTMRPAAAPALLRATIQEGSGPPLAATIEEFATGIESPIDIAVDRDGTLLVLDYASASQATGKLYRLVYTGG